MEDCPSVWRPYTLPVLLMQKDKVHVLFFSWLNLCKISARCNGFATVLNRPSIHVNDLEYGPFCTNDGFHGLQHSPVTRLFSSNKPTHLTPNRKAQLNGTPCCFPETARAISRAPPPPPPRRLRPHRPSAAPARGTRFRPFISPSFLRYALPLRAGAAPPW